MKSHLIAGDSFISQDDSNFNFHMKYVKYVKPLQSKPPPK